MQFKRQLEQLSKQHACHPKMMALQSAVLDHFKIAMPDEEAAHEGVPSRRELVAGRIIIFSSFRESVTEILTMLNKHEPAVQAKYVFSTHEWTMLAFRKYKLGKAHTTWGETFTSVAVKGMCESIGDAFQRPKCTSGV